MKLKTLLIVLVISFSSVYTQEFEIEKIRKNLENFEYGEVIELSEELLSAEVELSDSQKIAIYTMEGVAYYSTGKIDEARESFLEILKINDSYSLNPVKISPKIIKFYSKIKEDYSAVNRPKEDEIKDVQNSENDGQEPITQDLEIKKKVYSYSLLRSFAAPGWGHLYLNGSTKGWFLTTASSAALGAMLYFIYDTNQKETAYLNEVDKSLIQEKYDEYNTSYKIRNGLIFTYTAIWLYSQIDLLFFSEELFNRKIQTKFGYLPSNSDQFFISFRMVL